MIKKLCKTTTSLFLCVGILNYFQVTQANPTEIETCQTLIKILKPRGNTSDSCYNKARELNTQAKVSAGNYAEYLKLSKNLSSQAECRLFLKTVFETTQTFKLEEAEMLFENEPNQSLDQSYYSYQQCMDREIKLKSQSKPASQSTGIK